MEKIASPNAKPEFEISDAPSAEPNSIPSERSGEDSDKGHSPEPEKVVEWGGPNNRYGKLNVILGKGAYKVVWKAIDKEEGVEVAWNCCQTTRSEFNEFSEEVEILKKVRHPNIITFHDSWYSNGEFVFITELMTSGTLREYIKKLKAPSIKIIRRWARQILKGLMYLHSHNPPIIHRDIKCDNLFINGSHGEVKIGDMGTAKMRFGKKYTVIGTPEFMAPEMYEERGYSEKVDIYAFGMCLLEMVTGEYPYSECKNAAQIYKKVSQGVKPECLSKVTDKDVLALLNHCLAPENERWSAKKLSEHPFLLEEPEVILISANEARTKLKLQVLFKGQEKHSIKFEYNREADTAEDVVREMIEEKVLPSKFQGLVCHEIHRILKEISKNALNPEKTSNVSSPLETGPRFSEEQSLHRRVPSEYDSVGTISVPHLHSRSQSRPRQSAGSEFEESISRGMRSPIEPSIKGLGMASMSVDSSIGPGTLLSAHRRGSLSTIDMRISDGQDPSLEYNVTHKDYANDHPVDEFIMEVATDVNRPTEKAQEWIATLKAEDILTVGDLRDLLEEDWARINLTVFATRAIKNALCGKLVKLIGLEALSPRVSGRIPSDNATMPHNL